MIKRHQFTFLCSLAACALWRPGIFVDSLRCRSFGVRKYLFRTVTQHVLHLQVITGAALTITCPRWAVNLSRGITEQLCCSKMEALEASLIGQTQKLSWGHNKHVSSVKCVIMALAGHERSWCSGRHNNTLSDALIWNDEENESFFGVGKDN